MLADSSDACVVAELALVVAGLAVVAVLLAVEDDPPHAASATPITATKTAVDLTPLILIYLTPIIVIINLINFTSWTSAC